MLEQSFETVAVKNRALKKLRLEVAHLQKDLSKEQDKRARVEDLRRAAERKAEPLRGRALELEYKLNLQGDWKDTALTQLTALEGELATERAYVELITKQIRVLSRERDNSLEDSAHKQLLVQDLFEDNTELQKGFARLQRERQQLQDTLRQMMDELQASAEARAELTGEIDALHTWREAIENEMDDRDNTVQELSTDVDQLKVTLKKEVKEKETMEDAMGALRVQIYSINSTRKDNDALPLVKQVAYTKKAKQQLEHHLYKSQVNENLLAKAIYANKHPGKTLS